MHSGDGCKHEFNNATELYTSKNGLNDKFYIMYTFYHSKKCKVSKGKKQ